METTSKIHPVKVGNYSIFYDIDTTKENWLPTDLSIKKVIFNGSEKGLEIINHCKSWIQEKLLAFESGEIYLERDYNFYQLKEYKNQKLVKETFYYGR